MNCISSTKKLPFKHFIQGVPKPWGLAPAEKGSSWTNSGTLEPSSCIVIHFIVKKINTCIMAAKHPELNCDIQTCRNSLQEFLPKHMHNISVAAAPQQFSLQIQSNWWQSVSSNTILPAWWSSGFPSPPSTHQKVICNRLWPPGICWGACKIIRLHKHAWFLESWNRDQISTNQVHEPSIIYSINPLDSQIVNWKTPGKKVSQASKPRRPS